MILFIFGRPFVKRFAICYRSVVLCVLSFMSVTLVYSGQTVGWIKTKQLGVQMGLGPGNIVLDDNLPPLPKGTQLPNSRPISVVAKWLDGSKCHLVGS